ncbi:hypothetical protein U729_3187 (plasmid) [Clostridium baratii str. Sullivan]|uniref:Uncharacterized protein n=1 Tax=Clostridium baratii str. Sullivan TaxID=1415775 RepID=A0A0A7G047_9CLOT|nr:hypothetical protein [Clostridium baratii]AIY85228.1 hypothetical protein U729_3187 [Clostridium baratii str. Sullivan]
MEMKIINLDTWEKDMIDYIASFDADASGENGEDYLIDKNYKSNTEYWIDKVKNSNITFKSKVECVMDQLIETYYAYRYKEYGVISIDEKTLAVAFSCEYK